ncbi:hypothetical protein [Roseibium sp.]|uniref:hypothetical protein n=1 Tax=Roseibium sp. TaxID=1936156 RepID=UPI003D127B25
MIVSPNRRHSLPAALDCATACCSASKIIWPQLPALSGGTRLLLKFCGKLITQCCEIATGASIHEKNAVDENSGIRFETEPGPGEMPFQDRGRQETRDISAWIVPLTA